MVSTKALGAIALTLVIACPLALGYVLSFDEEETTAWKTTDQFNVSDLLLNNMTEYTQVYSGPNNNRIIDGDYFVKGSTVTSLPVYTKTAKSLTLTTSYQTVSDAYFQISLHQGTQIRLTFQGGTTEEITNTADVILTKYDTGVVILKSVNAKEFTGVASVAVKSVNPPANPTVAHINYYAFEPNGQYADPSAGWGVIPGRSAGWSNGFYNESVVFMVDLMAWGQPTATVAFELEGNNLLYLKMTDGALSYGLDGSTFTLLGQYDKARVEITKETFTISGVVAWPALGATATTYNSVTLDHPATQSLLGIGVIGVEEFVKVRADSAEIPAGSYPSTKDCTLDLAELFPDTMMSLRLNSVGVYGDSLDIGGMDFAVENGRITVDGRPVSLKGAMISFLPDADGWLVGTIGGRELGHFAELPSITFGGEWSLTATAYKVEETTGTSTEWQPGGFGLDKDGLIAAGLLTACGVFVLLGMYGRASGTKVGILAVICGGAAIVYFMLI